MLNDSTLRQKWKANVLQFFDPLAGAVSKPVHKLGQEVVYGALSNGSLRLSAIGRALQEPHNLHHTEKRLSRMLGGHAELANQVEALQISQAGAHLTSGMILAIDPGDLCRDGATQSEYRARVRDGSTGETVGGYPLISVVARDIKTGRSLPMLTRLHSSTHPDYSSENTEILSVMATIKANLPATAPKPFWVMDRGGDRGRLWQTWLDAGDAVCIRVTNQRHWHWRDRKLSAQEIAKKLPCKHEGRLTRGDKRHVRFGITKVTLPQRPETPLYMTVVRHGSMEPLVLVTNSYVRGKSAGQRMIRAYMDRWACEEGYRFTKQGFAAENVMVRAYTALKNLVALASLAWAFLACMDRTQSLAARDRHLKPKRPPNFPFYSMLAGWQNLFAAAKTGLYNLLRPQRSASLPLFEASTNQ